MHFVDQIIRKSGKFTYLHRFEVTKKDIRSAKDNKITIEIDLSYDEERHIPFVGHPYNYYSDVIGSKPPANITFESLIDLFLRSRLHIVFDCKDVRVFPFLEEIVKGDSKNRLLFHSFIKEWSEPIPKGVRPEAHWIYEHLPLFEVEKFIKRNNLFWIGTIRGYSQEWLNNSQPVEKVLKTDPHSFRSIGIYMPKKYIPNPPIDQIKLINDKGYYPVWVEDYLSKKFDCPHIALTENINNASVLLDSQGKFV